MTFVSGRCPNCGGEIHLDDSKDKGFCLHCGSSIQVQEAVALLKVEHSGSVQLSGVATDESLVKRGYIEIDNYHVAIKAFDAALNVNPENYMAWKGLFDAKLQWNRKKIEDDQRDGLWWNVLIGYFPCCLNKYQISIDYVGDPKGEKAAKELDNAIKYAPAKYKQELINMKHQYITLPPEQIERINSKLKSGKCLYCGGQISWKDKCKICKRERELTEEILSVLGLR